MNKSGNFGKTILKIVMALGVIALCAGVMVGGFILGSRTQLSTAPEEAKASEGTEAEVASDTIEDDEPETPAEDVPAETATAEAADAEVVEAAETAEAAPAGDVPAENTPAEAAKTAETAAAAPTGDVPSENAPVEAAEAVETAEAAPTGDVPAENVPAASADAKAAENAQPASADAKAGETAPAGTAEATPAAADPNAEQDPLLIAALNDPNFWDGCPNRQVLLLTPNPYSRPQTPIKKVNTLVIHYVANPGSSAVENRDYFESLSDGSVRSASAHFIIGLDGEIVQCIPISEVAYACKDRNGDTLSIECCHPDESGKFSETTYYSLVDLAGWLCLRLNLNPQDIIRHYDATGKDCPKYYVEHEDSWQQLKKDIEDRYNYLKEHQEAEETEEDEE